MYLNNIFEIRSYTFIYMHQIKSKILNMFFGVGLGVVHTIALTPPNFNTL